MRLVVPPDPTYGELDRLAHDAGVQIMVTDDLQWGLLVRTPAGVTPEIRVGIPSRILDQIALNSGQGALDIVRLVAAGIDVAKRYGCPPVGAR